jgi:sterol desaturase/sphingolipid hydroxylase (fatty acid hydroxylase superfamily)
MILFTLAITGSLSLLLLVFIFLPMERVFPAKKDQKILRPQWKLDLLFFFGQYLIWNAVVFFVLAYFNKGLQSFLPESYRQLVSSQAWWLRMIEVILLSDFIIYWAHRLQHKVDFLWRFHKVHHTAEHLDWLAAHREHPLDTIYTVGLINLPAFLLGFPLDTIAGFIAFRGIWAIYIHSNVRFSHRWIRMLIGAPELHHWHHDRERDAGNYANLSPIMDKLFGTYTCPNHEPESFGIKEDFPQHYGKQLLYPILPQKVVKRLASKKDDKNTVEP